MRISRIITVRNFRYYPCAILHCLCVQSESESFRKSSRKNLSLVFKTDLFNDSDNDKRFFGFHAKDIVLQEVVADSDIDVNEVSSVHTSSISWTGVTDSNGDWDENITSWTGVTDSNGDWNENITIGIGGVGERGRLTIDSPKEFAAGTRINTDLDVAYAS